jgi:2-keto-3-deoxy-L-rhamnonate aldolase RhmA
MAKFALKEKLRAGECVYGTMLTECLTPELAPLMAAAGLDFFIIDTEHSPATFQEVEALCRAGRSANIAPLVRITDNEYHLIARTMDCGAAGVVAPRINSAAEAERVVAAVKYPPRGRRGYGIRGILNDFQPLTPPQAMAKTDEESIVIVQVESGEAIDDLPNTVKVPGIDATMVGPNDLSISLGLAGEFGNPKFNEAMERIAKACKGSPVAAGCHFGDEKRLQDYRAMGYTFLNFSADMAMLGRGIKEYLKLMKGSSESTGNLGTRRCVVYEIRYSGHPYHCPV